jgi:hypothetical protein
MRPDLLLPPSAGRSYAIHVGTSVDRVGEEIIQGRPVDPAPLQFALAQSSRDADRHLDVMVDEVDHDLANGSEPFKQLENQPYRRLRLFIGIKGDIARRSSHVAHRDRLAQLASLSLCPPPSQHARFENVQFRFRHRSLRDREILPRNSCLMF